MNLRINKYLSECGIASRRKSEELVEQGRISINGKIISDLSVKIDTEKDVVAVDGEKIKFEDRVYFILNKPKGFITSTSDEKDRKTVIELIKTDKKIFPVGRLDYNTTGLLLLTNDGDFSNKMTHPSNRIIREYKATLDKPLEEKDRERLSKGIILDNRKSRFNSIEFKEIKNWKKVNVTTVEGRNHFVKRMFSSLGYNVKSLERIKFGNFQLGKLRPGEYMEIKKKEIEKYIDVKGGKKIGK